MIGVVMASSFRGSTYHALAPSVAQQVEPDCIAVYRQRRSRGHRPARLCFRYLSPGRLLSVLSPVPFCLSVLMFFYKHCTDAFTTHARPDLLFQPPARLAFKPFGSGIGGSMDMLSAYRRKGDLKPLLYARHHWQITGTRTRPRPSIAPSQLQIRNRSF